ncbi:flavodoxin family protein [Candidatus Omnitrophota bacterium]
MRAIIIYYSYSGNTKIIADALFEYLKAQYEVKIARLQAPGESSVFVGQAVRALFHKRTGIVPIEIDLSSYDLICLGTPVWAFAPTPAMNTYLDQCIGLAGKPVACFTTYGSGTGVQRCLTYMESILTQKGARDFKRFSIQQFKVNDKAFVNKVISTILQHELTTRL